MSNVLQCSKRGAESRLIRMLRAKNMGASHGLIWAGCDSEDATCCTRALSVGAVDDEVSGVV